MKSVTCQNHLESADEKRISTIKTKTKGAAKESPLSCYTNVKDLVDQKTI